MITLSDSVIPVFQINPNLPVKDLLVSYLFFFSCGHSLMNFHSTIKNPLFFYSEFGFILQWMQSPVLAGRYLLACAIQLYACSCLVQAASPNTDTNQGRR